MWDPNSLDFDSDAISNWALETSSIFRVEDG